MFFQVSVCPQGVSRPRPRPRPGGLGGWESQHALRQTVPPPPADGYCCGWYASYCLLILWLWYKNNRNRNRTAWMRLKEPLGQKYKYKFSSDFVTFHWIWIVTHVGFVSSESVWDRLRICPIFHFSVFPSIYHHPPMTAIGTVLTLSIIIVTADSCLDGLAVWWSPGIQETRVWFSLRHRIFLSIGTHSYILCPNYGFHQPIISLWEVWGHTFPIVGWMS